MVTAACLADVGHDVLCVDINTARIAQLQSGFIPIYEPGLEALIAATTADGRLRFTASAEQGVAHGVLQFIAVGTPPDSTGATDLRQVFAVADVIGNHMQGYKVLINKSTVPVGTADQVRDRVSAKLMARGIDPHFDVCSNPEFLKEGAAIDDFSKGPRIVIGASSEQVVALMRECYAPYNRQSDKLLVMDIRSAELTKYAANAMLATKISFMNEMANIAEHVGADIEQVRRGIGSDPRIGYQFIYPGCGYGGSCFPKDVQSLIKTAEQVGCPARLITATEAVNNDQKGRLFAKLVQALGSDLSNRTIAVWGLAFKPDTDDMRDAPSRNLMEAIWAAGGRVRAYDPHAAAETLKIYGERPDLFMAMNKKQALEGADALVLCTEWKEFRAVDYEDLAASLRARVLVDGRNQYQPERARAAGLIYFGIGRGESV